MFFQLRNVSKKYLMHREYLSYVDDILSHDAIKSMGDFLHHGSTSTLEHSLNVSYYTFLLCKILKLNAQAGARAGLLHDLFLYDWHQKTDPKLFHTFNHPIYALNNAKKHFELNKVEEEMILLHMYPMVRGFKTPRYAETFVLAFVDKICAISECARILPVIIERRFSKIVLGCAVTHGFIGNLEHTLRSRA